MPPTGAIRAVSRAAILLPVVLLLLVSCGGGDGDEGAGPTLSPTRTPTRTPTESLPSPELPSISRTPTRTGSPERPSPTRSPGRTDSPEQPTPTRSPEPTDSPEQPIPTGSPEQTNIPNGPLTEGGSALPSLDPTASETLVPDSTEAEDEAPAAEDGSIPPWVWLLLAALILGTAVAFPLVVRSRRRNAWRRDLAEAEGEVAWFARELLPELRQVGSRERVAGGWTVGQPRVAAAEDRLTLLESSAPDDVGRERARSLRDASRQARGRMQQVTGPGGDTWALDLDAIIADLELTLQRHQVT